MKRTTYKDVRVSGFNTDFTVVVTECEGYKDEIYVEHKDYWANPVDVRYSSAVKGYRVSCGGGGSNQDISDVQAARIKAEALLLGALIVENLNGALVWYNGVWLGENEVEEEK